jgi:hypothetical protein
MTKDMILKNPNVPFLYVLLQVSPLYKFGKRAYEVENKFPQKVLVKIPFKLRYVDDFTYSKEDSVNKLIMRYADMISIEVRSTENKKSPDPINQVDIELLKVFASVDDPEFVKAKNTIPEWVPQYDFGV